MIDPYPSLANGRSAEAQFSLLSSRQIEAAGGRSWPEVGCYPEDRCVPRLCENARALFSGVNFSHVDAISGASHTEFRLLAMLRGERNEFSHSLRPEQSHGVLRSCHSKFRKRSVMHPSVPEATERGPTPTLEHPESATSEP